jgi:hypothetical protein
VHDALPERLVRRVRAFAPPGLTACGREGAYDSPGELRAQLVDREPAPGQDGAELGAGQLDRLGKAQAKRVQRLLDAQDEAPSRALGGRW